MNFIDLTDSRQNSLKFTKPGQYTVFFFNRSGNLDIEIQNRNIEVNVLGLYIGKNQDNFNVQTKILHQRPSSKSKLLIKGLFQDQSQFHYAGLIKILPHAEKTEAVQKNQNLVLSKKVQITSQPFLEIENNDVICSHASTTGELPQEQLYYLQNRGLSLLRAQQLLVHGFINEIFDIMEKLKISSKIIETYKHKIIY